MSGYFFDNRLFFVAFWAKGHPSHVLNYDFLMDIIFGLALIMIGNGVQLVLLGVRASDAGFTNFTSGIVMGGYFLGLFLGSLMFRFLARVGHIFFAFLAHLPQLHQLRCYYISS